MYTQLIVGIVATLIGRRINRIHEFPHDLGLTTGVNGGYGRRGEMRVGLCGYRLFDVVSAVKNKEGNKRFHGLSTQRILF